MQTLGIERLSKSQVSRMAKELDAEVAAFRNRPLDGGPYTYVSLDAMTQKVREGGRIVNVAVVIAVGVNAEGHREVLGFDVITTEDGAGWLAFLRGLVARGLAGTTLVISDAHPGLVDAVRSTLTGATWQRCRTHFMLGVSIRSTAAAGQVVTVRPAASHGSISCWPRRIRVPLLRGAGLVCGSGGSRRWLERSLSCRTQLCRSGSRRSAVMLTDETKEHHASAVGCRRGRRTQALDHLRRRRLDRFRSRGRNLRDDTGRDGHGAGVVGVPDVAGLPDRH